MPSDKKPLVAMARADQNCNPKGMKTHQPELQISISAELLQELLMKKSIKACQVRCLNPETAGRLKSMCMDCCAKNLFTCPVAARPEIQLQPKLHIIQPMVSGIAAKPSD